MTQDIIRMAREANRYASNQTGDSFEWQEIRDERFAALVAAAEREAIGDEYSSRLQSDLENGVRWLNENAASEFNKKYPQLAGFNTWLNKRDGT